MNDGQSAKQQIVEQIKQNSSILVTVGTDPSVDELSAALGLTILLNKLNKHTTAVVSGQIPPAIEFLDPGKTFESTVDSLRDFIIALDKEKADHLRYKVDGDVVKIFITPYRTTINENDLDFSQGDYNVELVLALGVKSQDQLDKALEAHGRILHDATVATLTCDGPSKLGSISWNEPGASSISEMVTSMSEALKSGDKVIDEQVATALLTGIVAATDRFSNNQTSSKVMTMAAQLMAAGANQQLIAAKLEEAHEIGTETSSSTEQAENKDGTTDLQEGASSKVSAAKSGKADEGSEEVKDKPANDGSLAISHEREGDLDAVARDVARDNQEDAAAKAEEALADQLKTVAPAAAASSAPSVEELQKDIAAASQEIETSAELGDSEPLLGGTLNATTEQAAEEKRREEENDRNKMILSHASTPIQSDAVPTFANSPINASVEPEKDEPGLSMLPPLPPIESAPASSPEPLNPAPFIPPTPALDQTPAPTLAEIDQQNRQQQTHVDALADVHAAFEAAPIPAPMSSPSVESPAISPAPSPMPDPSGLPPLPDFSTLPPPPPSPMPMPPVPDMSLPPAPGQPEQLGQIFGEVPPAPQAPADPGQFKIPGQG
ncbi:MAG TPA: hypothetical protein VGE13_02280 [Candidatus Saccharimonadales bacterium]